MTDAARGSGTAEDPWQLVTPPGKGAYQMWRDEAGDPPALVCQVGSTQLRYDLRAIDDLHAMLKAYGDWMPLGGADEQKPAAEGTVEAWGRSPDNPVGWPVRAQERTARPLRRLPAAAARDARARRGHARGPQQQDARPLRVRSCNHACCCIARPDPGCVTPEVRYGSRAASSVSQKSSPVRM